MPSIIAATATAQQPFSATLPAARVSYADVTSATLPLLPPQQAQAPRAATQHRAAAAAANAVGHNAALPKAGDLSARERRSRDRVRDVVRRRLHLRRQEAAFRNS